MSKMVEHWQSIAARQRNHIAQMMQKQDALIAESIRRRRIIAQLVDALRACGAPDSHGLLREAEAELMWAGRPAQRVAK